MLLLAIPVLHITDSARAEAFYCDVLGFTPLFAYRPDPLRRDPAYLGFQRDGLHLHLSSFRDDGVAGAVVYLKVEDVDAFYEEVKTRGYDIQLPPTNQTWGNREMHILDPDGNRFTVAQETG